MFGHSVEFAENDFLSTNGALLHVDITVPVDLQMYLADNGLPPYSVRSGHALIDTGAGISAVDESIFHELEIPPVESESIFTANGVADFKVFNAAASFPELAVYNLSLEDVVGCNIRAQSPLGFDLIMLLGREILRNFVMVYDGPKSRTMLYR